MGFYREHFAEITMIWISVLLIVAVVGLSFVPGIEKDTLSWLRGVANGFVYALLLALKIQAGVTTKDDTKGIMGGEKKEGE
jgi:hypothetical protein